MTRPLIDEKGVPSTSDVANRLDSSIDRLDAWMDTQNQQEAEP